MACDYSLKLSWGGRVSKPKNDGIVQFEPAAASSSQGSPSTPAASTSLTNHYVTKRIQDIDTVFQAAPAQKKVKLDKFIMNNGRRNIPQPVSADSPDSVASVSSYSTCGPSPVSPGMMPPMGGWSPARSPLRSPALMHRIPEVHVKVEPMEDAPASSEDRDGAGVSLDSFFGPVFDDLDFARDLDIIEETYPDIVRQQRVPAFYSALIKSATSPYDPPATNCSTSSGSSEEDEETTTSIPVNPMYAPDLLLEIPFYRDLFQFYFHRTAKLLIPTPDIYYNNPFMTILPRIALSTPHLLSLLLAYSASHRAKVLNQEMPSEMIGMLLSRTFKGLSVCLEDKKEAMSDSTLATAIMLCSFEILSETGASSWKTHLHGAREIVMARGIIKQSAEARADTLSSNPLALLNGSDVSETDVAFFLLRWVAYIDVLGALSSARATSVLDGQNQNISEMWSPASWNRARSKSMVSGQCADTLLPDDQIDFFLGFDVAMVPAFAKIADLARQRTQMGDRSPDANFLNSARSIETIVKECHQAGQRRRIRLLSDSLHNDILASSSLMNSTQLQGNYSTLCAVNSAFCFAALIHLYRRVMHLPQTSLPVLEAIEGLTLILERDIPPSSGAEMCLSFPIFSAGCEVPAGDLRERFKKRMLQSRTAEHTLITKAQLIIQECWRTGESWTKLMEDRGWNQVIM